MTENLQVINSIFMKDYQIDPLVQSLNSIKDDFKTNLYLKAVADCKIVGSVRAHEEENVCYIGRLFFHPDFQNRGIGRSLMLHIENMFKHCKTYSLFAAKRVTRNLHLYNSLGYNKVKEEKIKVNLTFIYFEKQSLSATQV